MKPGELLREEAAKWLDPAVKDRNAASALVQVEPLRSVFHSQQVAEKAIKAFLTLGSQCVVIDATLEEILHETEELTDYASAFRYPDALYEPDFAEATAALTLATRLFHEIRQRIENQPESAAIS